MPFYVSVSEGRSGATARPIFATSDPDVVRAVIQAMERRLEPAGRHEPSRSEPPQSDGASARG
jgi:hypothetical protein